MKSKVARSRRPEVVDDASGFAGLFDASALLSYQRPLLATSTDGVGTKVMLAQKLGKHDTIGIDLVGMVVDDLVVCGAEPLFMTDYIACGKVVPERIAEIVGGVAEGCRLAGCGPASAARPPSTPAPWAPDEYDLAGAATGVVEADEDARPGPGSRGRRGAGLASSGVHSNGYSLVRHIIKLAGLSLDAELPELGRTLGEELLEPTRIYSLDCLELARVVDVHAYAHITGGGLEGNLSRSLPATTWTRVLDRSSWTPPADLRRCWPATAGSAAGRHGPDLQPGRRHGRDRPAGGQRTSPAPAGRPRPAGLGARRDRRGHRSGDAIR